MKSFIWCSDKNTLTIVSSQKNRILVKIYFIFLSIFLLSTRCQLSWPLCFYLFFFYIVTLCTVSLSDDKKVQGQALPDLFKWVSQPLDIVMKWVSVFETDSEASLTDSKRSLERWSELVWSPWPWPGCRESRRRVKNCHWWSVIRSEKIKNVKATNHDAGEKIPKCT